MAKRRRKSLRGYTPTPMVAHVGYDKCERYSAQTKICIKGGKYGFSATLVGSTGGKLPISIPSEARSPRAAFDAAKKALSRVHGRNN